MKSRPCSPLLEKAHAQQQRPNAAKNKLIFKKEKKTTLKKKKTITRDKVHYVMIKKLIYQEDVTIITIYIRTIHLKLSKYDQI